MKRIFAAIKIEPSTHLHALFNEIRQHFIGENINWVEMKNLHITLKFFGETEEKNIKPIIETFAAVAAEHKPFELQLLSFGVFKSVTNPTVFWLGIMKNARLENLFRNINSKLQNIGYEAEKRSFTPHLTLARIKYLKNIETVERLIEKYKTTELKPQTINNFSLYESILSPKGAVYEVIETFNFAQNL